jgi:hypothetical protein
MRRGAPFEPVTVIENFGRFGNCFINVPSKLALRGMQLLTQGGAIAFATVIRRLL